MRFVNVECGRTISKHWMMNRKVVNPMNKTRPNRVYFRVTDTELELINESVKASGMTRQDWLLSKVMKIIKNDIVTKDGKGSKRFNIRM